MKRTTALADCLSVTGTSPRYRPSTPSAATIRLVTCQLDVLTFPEALERLSIIFVFTFSPGVNTVTLSAIPAHAPASILPMTDILPVCGSRGKRFLAKSNVANRTADLELFETQNVPAPVYSDRAPFCLRVWIRSLIGEACLPLFVASCCFVFMYSVGY